MIFPNLRFESVVQVGDMLRLDAAKSFVSDGEAITDVEIRPEAAEAYVSVFNTNKKKWYIDYAYALEGVKTVSVRVTTALGNTEKDFTLLVLTEDEDALLSSDSDLYPYEPMIDKYLPVGKNSFKYAHRAAQSKILGYLDEKRIWKRDGSRYTKSDLQTVVGEEFTEQFRLWSTFSTLMIILESSQVSNSDIFQEKKEEYRIAMVGHRNRASLSLDYNQDGEVDTYKTDIKSGILLRR